MGLGFKGLGISKVIESLHPKDWSLALPRSRQLRPPARGPGPPPIHAAPAARVHGPACATQFGSEQGQGYFPWFFSLSGEAA